MRRSSRATGCHRTMEPPRTEATLRDTPVEGQSGARVAQAVAQRRRHLTRETARRDKCMVDWHEDRTLTSSSARVSATTDAPPSRLPATIARLTDRAEA